MKIVCVFNLCESSVLYTIYKNINKYSLCFSRLYMDHKNEKTEFEKDADSVHRWLLVTEAVSEGSQCQQSVVTTAGRWQRKRAQMLCWSEIAYYPRHDLLINSTIKMNNSWPEASKATDGDISRFLYLDKHNQKYLFVLLYIRDVIDEDESPSNDHAV